MRNRPSIVALTLLVVGALTSLAALPASAGSRVGAAANDDALVQREANLWEIDQIEVRFHRATSTHNLNLMMSLWAPGAVFNIDQQTLTGKAQIRHWFATENAAFMPDHHWESDTPSYKIRISLNGDKATLYFECHYIDPKTSKVVALAGVTHTLQKINGTWLIVDSAGSPAKLSPWVRARAGAQPSCGSRRRRAGDAADQARRRVPRHRSAARPRDRLGPALSRTSERASREAGDAAAPGVHL